MISKRAFLLVLISLAIIRVIMVIGLVNGIPETQYHKGWFFHHGGDEEEFFRLASGLARFRPVASYRTLGFPLLLAPFIRLFRADAIEDILTAVVIFNSCILSVMGIFLIAMTAEKLTKDRRISVVSAALWTFLPYLLKIAISLLSPRHFEVAGIWMTHWMGLQVLSDPLSVFLVLSAIYLFLISMEKEKLKYAILGGAIFAGAVLTRPENGTLFVLFSLILLSQRKIKKFLIFAGSFLMIFSTQLLYNFYFHGSPFRFPILDFWKEYLLGIESAYTDVFSISNIPMLLGQLWVKMPRPILFLTASLLILTGWASGRIYKRQKQGAMILVLWVLLYVLVYGCFANIEPILWQYSMPFLPAVAILLSAAIVYTKNLCKK